MIKVSILNTLSILFFLAFIIVNIFLFIYNKFNFKKTYDILLLISVIFIILVLCMLTIYLNVMNDDIKKTVFELKKLPSKDNKIHMNLNIFWFMFLFSVIFTSLFFIMLILLSEKKLYRSVISEIFYILISISLIIYIVFLLIQLFIFKKEHSNNTLIFNKHKNKINLDNLTNFKNPLFNKND